MRIALDTKLIVLQIESMSQLSPEEMAVVRKVLEGLILKDAASR